MLADDASSDEDEYPAGELDSSGVVGGSGSSSSRLETVVRISIASVPSVSWASFSVGPEVRPCTGPGCTTKVSFFSPLRQCPMKI